MTCATATTATAFISAIAASFCALVAMPATAMPRIRDLGTLGGPSAFARDINEPGQIVGESATASGQTHAFIYTPWIGRMTDLGTLGGTFSQALAVADRGVVTGTSSLASGETRAFVWEQGRIQALPQLGGAMFSEGIDVNDSAVVVGQSGGVAVRWISGKVEKLGTLGGANSFATGINSSGVIVGSSSTTSGQFHAFVFRNGTMTDLGTFGGVSSTAEDINSSGDIVGTFEPTPGAPPHGYLLRAGVFVDLGVLGSSSIARGISNSGLIVGEGGGATFTHAVLWDYNRSLVDLGALPGSNFSSAFSVNSGGTIVGVSVLQTGFRAVVWQF